MRDLKLRSLNKNNRKYFNDPIRGKTFFTEEEDKFIKENYLTMPIKKMGDKLKRSYCGIQGRLNHYNLVIPREIIEQRKKDSQKRPGCIPMNKGLKQTDYMTPEQIERTKATRFKKGHIPFNAIGFKNGDVSIRIDHKNRSGTKYKWIRISMGHWKMLHHFLWEEMYGERPEGAVLRFKDGNQMNCTVDNLELIDKKTNMILNTIHRYPDELKRSMRLLGRLKKELNKTI